MNEKRNKVSQREREMRKKMEEMKTNQRELEIERDRAR